MRYYSIKLTDKNGQPMAAFPAVPGALVNGSSFTSFVNGKTDPNALNIELDIQAYAAHIAGGGSYVRLWGIGLNQLGQSSDLNGANIEVYGGMQAGLPLANPSQSGLLVRGGIQPAFGNWIGTDMTLDLVISLPFQTGQPSVPGAANVVHNWKKQTPLKDALQSTLTTAFPTLTPKININPKLILAYDDIGFYQTIEQYSQYLNNITKNIIGGTYPGVSLVVQNGKIIATDGTADQDSIHTINFQDLIGQPTWIGPNQISVKTVMRADLEVANKIRLPQSASTTTSGSASQLRNSLTFQGTWQVSEVRHVGNFRQPTAEAWVTVYNMTRA